LNNFSDWINQNKRSLIFLFVALVVLSSLIGSIFGIIRSKSYIDKSSLAQKEENTVVKRTIKEKNILLLPYPIIPNFDENFSEYQFYFNEENSNLSSLRLIPITPEELMKYKSINIENEIKAFEFDNEKLDILTEKKELSEP